MARRAHDKRTPGLLKVDWSGEGFVGLCSKTEYCFGHTEKYSTKGLSKRHNDIDKDAFPEVLTNRRSGRGKNYGFRVRQSTVLNTCRNGRLSPTSTPNAWCTSTG